MDTISDALAPRLQTLDPAHFRKAVSLFTTGVVIVSSEDGEAGVHGATVNSFTSISLSPPTVLISLKEGRMHRLISESGKYGISVLREEQQHYSSHFAGRPNESLEPGFHFDGSVPVLRESLAWFECLVVDKVRVKDHTLFIAEVVRCGLGEGAPLVFYQSRYHCQMQPA
jgi:styrene monooxygenase reductase component